jgi:hypothetical protein
MQCTSLWASQQFLAIAKRDLSSYFDEIDCNFLKVGDISTFKRAFYFMLHDECSARHLQRRKYLWRPQMAIILNTLTIIDCNFLRVGAISTFNRSFYSILHAKYSAPHFERRNNPWRAQFAIIRLISTKIDCNFLKVGDITTFNRSFYSSLHAECSVRHL